MQSLLQFPAPKDRSVTQRTCPAIYLLLRDFLVVYLPQLIGGDVRPVPNRIELVQRLENQMVGIAARPAAPCLVVVVFAEVNLQNL